MMCRGFLDRKLFELACEAIISLKGTQQKAPAAKPQGLLL
jgi:hypothetical protein